jgi:hypothetical protein
MDAKKCPNSCNVISKVDAITKRMVELIIKFFCMIWEYKLEIIADILAAMLTQFTIP